MRPTFHLLLLFFLFFLCPLASSHASEISAPSKVRIAGEAIHEASGLAASAKHPGLLWIINDGPGGSVLHAIGTDGSPRGRVTVTGLRTRDAEDLAAFSWRSSPHLLIADVGDNRSTATSYSLHAVPEPDPDAKSVRPAWSLTFRYEDGPHDCESVAVDSSLGQIFLVTKGRNPRLYSLPLGPQDGVAVAKLAGPVTLKKPARLAPTAALRHFATGGACTGLDFSPDNRTAALLSYSHINLFHRTDSESWAEAFSRPPAILAMPGLAQAEAIAFAPDARSLWVASEQLPAELARIPVPKP